MRLTFEFEGKVQFDRAFSRVGLHITDLRPTWPAVEKALQTIEQQQFKSEGSHGGNRWKSLTPAYAKRKAQKYGAKTILRATDRLYNALVGRTADTVVVREKDEFGYGTTLYYQPYVNKERPIVNLNSGDKTYIQKEIQKGILKQMKGDSAITSFMDIQE